MPFEIPESWEWVTVKEVCSKIGSGSTPRGSNYSKEGIPFFRSQNIYNHGIVYEDIKYISPDIHNKMRNTEVRPNDLLLNITGGSLGRCAVVPSNFKIGNVSQHVCIMRPVLILPQYLHAFCLSFFFTQTMVVSGSGREGLPKYSLENMLLPLPPQTEQQRIIIEIERWFKLIDDLESNKEDLKDYIKQVKSKVLSLAISGKLVPQDPNDEPAIELLKRINPNFKPCDTSHYENLPQGWTVVQLSDIAKTVTGSTPSKNNKSFYGGTFPFYKPSDLDAGRNVNEASEYLSEEGKLVSRIIPANSIAVCCIGSIGKCGYIMQEGSTNQQINTIIPFYNIYPLYIYYFCLSASFVQQLLDKSSAVTIAIVNKSKLDSTLILLPPLAEQKRIVERIETIFASLDTITAEL